MKLVKFTNTVVITDPIVDESSFGEAEVMDKAQIRRITLWNAEKRRNHTVRVERITTNAPNTDW